jgi:hypothetical protein
MNPKWKWFLPGYLFALPHTLIGLILTLIWYRPRAWRFADGVLECTAGRTKNGRTRIWGRPGAQTHGFLVVYASGASRRFLPLRRHERAHIVQGFLGGPLYVILYGLTFAWNYLRLREWRAAYLAIPFEKYARSIERNKGWGDRV